jgi:hypothetical protein
MSLICTGMEIERLSVVLPVDDLAVAAAEWAGLLGVEPTFVHGERWAQFDVAGTRISLAGTDRVGDRAALMVKVPDVPGARADALRRGRDAGELESGPHEVRCTVEGPGGTPVVLYAPIAR